MEINNILVTGGTGYLGCQVVNDLIMKYPSAKIIIIDNLSRGRLEYIGSVIDKIKAYNIKIIPSENSDIRDYDKIVDIFQKYKPEVVIHLAAILDAFLTNRPGKDQECYEVNYKATVNLARIAKENGTLIFINQSSVSMYSRGEELKEDSEKNPLSTYGTTKLKGEEEILKLADNSFKTTSLRDATLVGYTPGFTYQTIINLCCIRSVYNIPVNIFESALTGMKTYLDVKDASKSIIFSIENINKMNGQAFNISSFHANLNKVIELIETYLEKKIDINIVKEKKINQQVYTINSDKINSIGFKPEGKLKDIIEYTLYKLLKRKECYLLE